MGAMPNWKQHIVLDVESDGPCPGLYNMISFGLVCVGDPAQAFLGEVAPILDHAGVQEARDVVGVSYETQRTYREPDIVMHEAITWVNRLTEGKRAIFWSDNPAFDWQFWNWYCHKYAGENPGGFSARRIGDLDAGRRGEALNTSAFKKRRETAHTHNPVDDARGNAEALRWVLEQMGEKP
jgi:hypothetical protein